MPEEAIDINDKQQIYSRRFDFRLRNHLKTLVNPSFLSGVADNPNVYLHPVFINALENVSAPR